VHCWRGSRRRHVGWGSCYTTLLRPASSKELRPGLAVCGPSGLRGFPLLAALFHDALGVSSGRIAEGDAQRDRGSGRESKQ
jgi:hypothetical protein